MSDAIGLAALVIALGLCAVAAWKIPTALARRYEASKTDTPNTSVSISDRAP